MVLINCANDFSIGFNSFSIFFSPMKCEIKKNLKQNLSNHIYIFERIAIVYYESVIIVLYLSIAFCFRL